MPSITLHFANMLAQRVGEEHGLSSADLSAAKPRLAELTRRLETMDADGRTRWRRLPLDPMRSKHLEAVNRVVGELNAHFESNSPEKRCKHLIVLGIGGSALGNIALQQALKPHVHNHLPAEYRSGPQIFILDNVDPEFVGDVMRFVDLADPGLAHTAINVISKSGETAETAAQFLIFRDWMREHIGEDYAKQIVAITDPQRGTMRSIVEHEGYAALPVPDGVGGRFSVLSPVGLFSAAMCGIEIDRLLDGAAAMDARCRCEDPEENPAALLAWMLVEFTRRGKPNHVLMSYANSLAAMADWFRQLWAESLGKRHDLDGREVFVGPNPIRALGATDQHSQIQLYREGPNDKVIGFVEVERFDNDVAIPAAGAWAGVPTRLAMRVGTPAHAPYERAVEALSYLQGRTLGQLLGAEKKATEYALVESERPNFTISMPTIDAVHIGELIAMWQVATAYAGLLLNINAYDQPAVETGKLATFGLMGRAGYEEWKAKVEATLGSE